MTVALQIIDSFLLQFNVGEVLLFLFAVGLVATLPLKNKTVTGLHVLAFGLLLLVTPLSLMGNQAAYRFIGVALLFAGPMVMIVGD